MKQDRRIKKSKAALKQSLLTLLEKQPLTNISVTTLCEQADLNRSTFYANYQSMQDILIEIQIDLFDEMSAHSHHIYPFIENMPEEEALQAIVKMIQFMETKIRILKILFKNNEQQLFERNMTQYYMKKYNIDEKNIETLFPFFYHSIASFALLRLWIENKCPCSAKTLAKMIYQLSSSTIKKG
ncbi:MAG: TetR/AcrR family transcriptional regulator [Erysipelotrichia bacterium]|nr:TetR/AcrR family transcriptional regulator [Erysipelotrichia bacterium]NCC54547.1 TetR/AcrR family transcriptional regulator [Erysipelotrichia bacterium]